MIDKMLSTPVETKSARDQKGTENKQADRSNRKIAVGELFASLLNNMQGTSDSGKTKEEGKSSALTDLVSKSDNNSNAQKSEGLSSSLMDVVEKIKVAIGDTEGLSEEEILQEIQKLIDSGELSAEELTLAINQQLELQEGERKIESLSEQQSAKKSVAPGEFQKKDTVKASKIEKQQGKEIPNKPQENSSPSEVLKEDGETSESKSKRNRGTLLRMTSERENSLKQEGISKVSQDTRLAGEEGKEPQLTEKQKKFLASVVSGDKEIQGQTSTQSGQAEQILGKEVKRERSSQKGRGRSSLSFIQQGSGKVRSDFNLTLNTNTGSFDQESNDDFYENDILWKKHSIESGEVKEENSSERASVRFGQMPIGNGKLRRRILPTLTRKIANASAQAKANPGTWEKHNFVLDDGQKLQLSVREVKGVLQVKVGAINQDLSKLLQQYQQQIKTHLEQEFGSDIDLQFEGQDQQESSAFAGGDLFSGDSQKRSKSQSPVTLKDNSAVKKADEVLVQSARKFGYNQMEWTA